MPVLFKFTFHISTREFQFCVLWWWRYWLKWYYTWWWCLWFNFRSWFLTLYNLVCLDPIYFGSCNLLFIFIFIFILFVHRFVCDFFLFFFFGLLLFLFGFFTWIWDRAWTNCARFRLDIWYILYIRNICSQWNNMRRFSWCVTKNEKPK